MLELNLLQQISIWILPLLFAITVHEVAHGWVANLLGDPTAKMLGRITLNPIKHISLIGTIIVPIAMLILTKFTMAFGWAKPVPVTWQNLKHPRRDTALVAIAGPAANLVMALGWGLLFKLGLTLDPNTSDVALFVALTGQAGIFINLILMVLNLLPIPPLDGSRILESVMPASVGRILHQIEPYGFFIIVALLVTGLLHAILIPLLEAAYKVIAFILVLS